MKIVVLCGGLSTERKISFSSGTKICGALRARGHQAVLIDLFMGIEGIDGFEAEAEKEAASEAVIGIDDALRRRLAGLFEELPPLKPVEFDGKAPDLDEVRRSRKFRSASLFGRGVLEICQMADVVFIGLHGMNGEDGRVQATFDMLGIPYTGSGYLGAAMAMDKMITKQMVKPQGVPTPAWKEFHFGKTPSDKEIEQMAVQLSVPCVVKTPTGGSSVGVVIVKEESQLRPALRECLRFGNDLLVEQYIEGREFTCAVLRGRALPSVEIAPLTDFYNYENKYKAGATEEICPGRCTPRVEERMHEIALTVHRTLGLRTYSRSDFMIDADDNVWFLEVNTLPGMTPTSLVPQEAAAAGISYEELCEIIVNDAAAPDTVQTS